MRHAPAHGCGPEDNELTLARYGLTATEALARDGFFEGRVHASHCLDLSAADIAIFAAAPAASVAFCATAGLRSGREGICPAVALRQAGVVVALGTDNVAANNAYDMIAEMRVAGLVASHRERRAQPISSRELVRMATIDGARALGLEHEIGSLEPGKAADIIAIDIRAPAIRRPPTSRPFWSILAAAGMWPMPGLAGSSWWTDAGCCVGRWPISDRPIQPHIDTSGTGSKKPEGGLTSCANLILDTDGGVDDAQALLMLIAAGRTPDSITTVFGNVVWTRRPGTS